MSAGRWGLFLLLGMNAVQDLRTKEVLLIPTLLYGFYSLWFVLLTGQDTVELLISCIPGILFIILAIGTSGQVGFGDAWILLVLGIRLGLFPVLEIIWSAFFLLILAVFFLRTFGGKKIEEKTVIPLVPFLFLGTAIWELLLG